MADTLVVRTLESLLKAQFIQTDEFFILKCFCICSSSCHGKYAYAREARLKHRGLKDLVAFGISNTGASVLLNFFASASALVSLPLEQCESHKWQEKKIRGHPEQSFY